MGNIQKMGVYIYIYLELQNHNHFLIDAKRVSISRRFAGNQAFEAFH